MYRIINVNDECLSKHHGYGIVTEVQLQNIEHNGEKDTIKGLITVCFFENKKGDVVGKYNLNGEILSYTFKRNHNDLDFLNRSGTKVDLVSVQECIFGKPIKEAKFYKRGIRYVMFEKKYCNE